MVCCHVIPMVVKWFMQWVKMAADGEWALSLCSEEPFTIHRDWWLKFPFKLLFYVNEYCALNIQLNTPTCVKNNCASISRLFFLHEVIEQILCRSDQVAHQIQDQRLIQFKNKIMWAKLNSGFEKPIWVNQIWIVLLGWGTSSLASASGRTQIVPCSNHALIRILSRWWV